MALTKLNNLVNPEVMADMITATLPKKIKFSKLAKIDETLVGVPGDTVTVPKYGYIGNAENTAEGVAMGTTVLTASTTKVTVKKATKAVELSDEAMISGYGSPKNEATKQLTMAIAAKVDEDCYHNLCDAPLVYKGEAAKIGYAPIVDANSLFEDESDNALQKVIFINPLQESELRKDPDFMDRNKYNMDVVMDGVIGMIAGCQVVKSKTVIIPEYEKATEGTFTITEPKTAESSGGQSDGTHKRLDEVESKCLGTVKVGDKVNAVSDNKYYACPIVVVDVDDPNEDPKADGFSTDSPALTIYLKRDIMIEPDRDTLRGTTVIASNKHYGVALSNDSKVVLAKFKAPGA